MMDIELRTLADEYRAWVCEELGNLPRDQRQELRGDYVFLVDGSPCFVVLIDTDLHSTALVRTDGKLDFSGYAEVPFSPEETASLLSGGAFRCRILTDRTTLRLLLLGRLRARVAYLSGAVVIEGDLPAFLRLVSLLKRQGVRPRLDFELEPQSQISSAVTN